MAKCRGALEHVLLVLIGYGKWVGADGLGEMKGYERDVNAALVLT